MQWLRLILALALISTVFATRSPVSRAASEAPLRDGADVLCVPSMQLSDNPHWAESGPSAYAAQLVAAFIPKKIAPLPAERLPRPEKVLDLTYARVPAGKMSGAYAPDKSDYYFLEAVPWVMYFDGDRALHGQYWHDALGYKRSHGCVNLAPLDARWLYEWSS